MTELLSGDESSARVKVEIRDDSSGGGQTPPATTTTTSSDHLTSSSQGHAQNHTKTTTPPTSNNNIVVSLNNNSCTGGSSSGNGRTTATTTGTGTDSTTRSSGQSPGQSSKSGGSSSVTETEASDYSGCSDRRGSCGGGNSTTTTNTTTTSHHHKIPTATTISIKNSSTTGTGSGGGGGSGSDRFPISSSSCRDYEGVTGEGVKVKGQIHSNAVGGHGGQQQQQQQSHDAYAKSTSKEDLLIMCTQLEKYVETIERKHREEVTQMKEAEEKIRVQQLEASRRENVLVMRLTAKEQEMQDYAAQLNELKASMVPTSGALRSTLLDPAVNFIIQKMKTELDETKKKLEDTQNDLNAWKFTPDSNTGKRLMAKCRMLYQENEELGKMVGSGRLAKLESDLALQKSLTVEMKKSQSELDELVQELDEDVEGMQSTILFLQQELRKSNSSTVSGLGNEGAGSSTSDSLTPENNANSRNNCISETGLVQLKLSDLCAQCRTVYDGVENGEKILTHTNAVTPTTSNTTNIDPVDSPISPVENSERTCVNGEVDGSHSSNSKSTSNQSVRNVVNLITNANECDETDGGPPTAKRTKLHGDTAVVNMKDHPLSQSSEHSGDTSSFNGNGSVEY